MKNSKNEINNIDEKLKSIFVLDNQKSGLDGIEALNFTNKIMKQIERQESAKKGVALAFFGFFISLIMASSLIYWRECFYVLQTTFAAIAPSDIKEVDLKSISLMLLIIFGAGFYYYKTQ